MAKTTRTPKKLFETELPLGAIYTPECTTFRVFAPTAKHVEVVTYTQPSGEAGQAVYPLGQFSSKELWETTVTGDLEGLHYMLRVTTKEFGTVEVVDPYAVNTVGRGERARITNLRATDPEGFRPVTRPEFSGETTDAVVWEVHIRDFSVHRDSGAQHRGKYLAFAEKTHLPGNPDVTTCVEHLRELGVTHVHLLPPFDFERDHTNPDYNWGYMTNFFNSPEGWFASDATGTAKITEFKRMVQALHAEGLCVIIDVVYNHTSPLNTFEHVAPGYYHRMRDNGEFYNGSWCGNEINSEAPMVRRFIVDSCRYWLEEYGVDGIRFDLMGLIDLDTLVAVRTAAREIYPGAIVYGEPWVAGECGLAQPTFKDRLRGTGIGGFNDHFRNALKGDTDGEVPGYLQAGWNRDAVKAGIEGSIHDWAFQPGESVNYVTCHDNLTLWDKLAISTGPASEWERMCMQRFAMALLAFSQGMFFMHSGCELLRSKDGDHNSYNKGDAVNAIRWGRKVKYPGIYDYVRQVIGLRRRHPVFRLASRDAIEARLRFHDDHRPHECAIVFTLDGRDMPGEKWSDVVVLINPNYGQQDFHLPLEGEFGLYVFGIQAGNAVIERVKHGRLVVPGRSLALLAR